MRDLVVMSLERWDGVWRRNQYLVDGLLLRHPDLRVLFVEPAADPLHALRRRERPRRGTGLTPVDPHDGRPWRGRLWTLQPTKWLPRRLDRRADERLARSTVDAASRLQMHHPVLWVNDPFGAEVLRRTGWSALYDITDDWLLADRSPPERSRLARQEEQLLATCKEVVVCSPRLQSDKGLVRQVRLVPNAVDVQAYRQVGPRPTDLPRHPVVLYLGTLHRDRLDVDLCLELARRISGRATFVLVGPAALEAEDRRRLAAAGARLLGPRDAAAVPAYLQHAEVLVVPHVVTPFTESLDPIKAYEYRAAGRPVVSTPVPGFRDSDSGLVRCADTHDAFVAAVDELLRTGHIPTVSVEDVADWSLRVAQFDRILRQVGDGAGG